MVLITVFSDREPPMAFFDPVVLVIAAVVRTTTVVHLHADDGRSRPRHGEAPPRVPGRCPAGAVAGIDLVEREILAVGRPATNSLVDPSMQLRDSPGEIALAMPRVKRPAPGIDPRRPRIPPHLILNPLVQRCAARLAHGPAGWCEAGAAPAPLDQASRPCRRAAEQRRSLGIADRLHVGGPHAALFQDFDRLRSRPRPARAQRCHR